MARGQIKKLKKIQEKIFFSSASQISQGFQEFEYSMRVALAEQGSSYKIHTSGYKQWYCTVMKQLTFHQIDWDDG